MKIDLDFYVPVKDGEAFIGECLQALLEQTSKPKRIVVYYNVNSTDNTLKIIKKFPVECVEVTVPLSDARNLALRQLTTDWIGSVDADVIVAKDWLERLWEHTNKNVSVISGHTKERLKDIGDYFRQVISPHNWGAVDVHNPYMLVPDKICKRKRLLEIGSYKTGMVNFEDSEISRRLKEAGDQFYYVAGACATHYRNDGFESCLDLRYKHSLPRQLDLLKSAQGFEQKILNNICMGTMAFGLSDEFSQIELKQICLLLPLHHFIWDIRELQKQKSPICNVTSENNISDEFSQLVIKCCGPSAEKYLNELKRVEVTWYKRFCFFYNIFLIQAQSVLQNSFAVSPLRAMSENDFLLLIQKTKDFALKLFNIKPLWHLKLESGLTQPLSDASGIITFCQPVYPESHKVWSCRLMTEQIAKWGRKIIWTETFLGSTVIICGAKDA